MTSSELQLTQKLQKIRATSLKLLRHEHVKNAEWHAMFWLVHTLSIWDEKNGESVYRAIERDIVSTVETIRAKIPTRCQPEVSIKAYADEWKNFSVLCKYYPKPFSQIEKKVRGDNKPYNVRNLMLDSWNQSFFSDKSKLIHKNAMKLIEAERNGRKCDPQLIVTIRESFVNLSTDSDDELSVYGEFYEKAYFEETRAFYRLIAQEYLSVHGVEEYVKFADLRLAEEEKMAEKYLESISRLELMKICGDVLVFPFRKIVLAECAGMIERNEFGNLRRIFRLMNRAPECISGILDEFENYIVKVGLADMLAAAQIIVQDSEKYVQQLLDLFDRFGELVTEAFQNDPRFISSRDKMFKKIINDTALFKLQMAATARSSTRSESRCPELLANFCDVLLRKTNVSKKLVSENIEIKLKGVILLLNYVENKDVFMIYYKSHLTRRLILETSADGYMEENMVTWLREAGMPSEYVSKVSRMFLDIAVSRDLNRLFKELNSSVSDSININIKILNSAAWSRTSEPIPVSLPMELEDYVSEMELFYRKQHGGRRLVWHHQMSNGTITFANDIGNFDLDVTTFQMAVLFAWNERPKERISFENLKLATELPGSELRKTIWSVVSMPMAKRNIVKCFPEVTSPSGFTNETQFWINDEFALIRNGKIQKRGKINLIGRLQLSTEKCKLVDNEAIVRLREFRLQEAIVRIAKARKVVANSQLQNELVGILRNMFLPTNRMIKQQVEWLIENDYMRRDENDNNILVYVA